VKVQDSNNVALEGKTVKYRALGTDFTLGVTNADGITSAELFAGTYNMWTTVNYTDSGKRLVDITQTGIDYTFVATVVTMNFSGTIRYYAGGSNVKFTSPQAMFPGTYKFTFSKSGNTVTRQLTIGDSPVNDSIGIVALLDSNGNGLEGGAVSYYAGGWANNVATTGSDGYALLQVPAGKNPTSVAMNYKGGRVQINQNMSVNPYYEFRTLKVELHLLSSEGDKLDGFAEYHGEGWKIFGDNGEGNTNISMEMLPAKYSFRVTYAGATQQKKMRMSTPHLLWYLRPRRSPSSCWIPRMTRCLAASQSIMRAAGSNLARKARPTPRWSCCPSSIRSG
jgi:hypothetical protein